MSDESAIALEFEKPIIELESRILEIKNINSSQSIDLDQEIKSLEEKRIKLIQEIFSSLTPWQRVQLARHPKRPYTLDYIRSLFTDFIELHGDRSFSDDTALVSGCAFFEGMPVMVMGHQKGRAVEESLARNFGMMHPEGYRKALRIMKLAEKFDKPIITFIDTPGAYPGVGAEERGQAEAIARNLREMSALKTPIISVVIGEGGSGGALGIGVSDRILMLENSWYSVISPEGCAAILFRDSSRAEDAAKALKLTSEDLLSLHIIDDVVPEPLGGAHRDVPSVMASLKAVLLKHLKELMEIKLPDLLKARYEKYRKIGSWTEKTSEAASPAGKNPKRRTRKKPGPEDLKP